MGSLNPDKVEAPQKITAQRKRLWNALHDYIRQHGAAVVSVPGHKEMRIEIPKKSALPAKLAEFGYRPHHLCVTSRISAGAFETVDVVSILLPGFR